MVLDRPGINELERVCEDHLRERIAN